MAIPTNQLVLDRFIEFNVDRYKDNPALVLMFQGLTLEDVQISNFRRGATVDGAPTAIYDITKPGVFVGLNQVFWCADIARHGILTFSEEDPVEVASLPEKVEGVYTGDDDLGYVVANNGEMTPPNILAIVQDHLKYEIYIDDLVVDLDGPTLNSYDQNIVGNLGLVESLYDEFPRYNGQYRLDGSVSAL